jgi:hypothetical protein
MEVAGLFDPHACRVILVSEFPASSVQYEGAGKHSALYTQIQENPSHTDLVDFEGALEGMVHLVPWIALLLGIPECPVVTDTQGIEVLAQEERVADSFEDLAQTVLLTHWNLSSLAPCLVWKTY